MADPRHSGRGTSQVSGTPEAAAWWQAVLASHTAKSVVAMVLVIAAIAVVALSIN